MTQLNMQQKATITVVESYLKQMADNSFDRILLPPKPIKIAGLGGESALIQCLLTWARQCPKGEVVTQLHLGDSAIEERELKHLANRPYSFAALLAANDVLAADASTSIRSKTNKACSTRVDAMAKGLQKATFGHRTFLACVDHSTKGNIPAFYFADGTLRTRSEFIDLAEDLLMSRAEAYTTQYIPRDIRNELGLILYELFKNTDDWARTDLEKVPLRPSLRGLFFTRLSVNLTGAIASAGSNPLLESYVRDLGEQSKDEYVRFLELSIFDSGPGMAARWLKRPLNSEVKISEELNACFACLAKHKTGSKDSTRGLGLFDVMNTLNELQAYMRLRSGRLALCRNFITNPLRPEEQKNGPELYDWQTESTSPTLMSPATGTLLTIVIPMLEKDN